MADGPHYQTHEVQRREHNDQAMAKRTLNISYDYINSEYVVPGVLKDGRVPVFTDPEILEGIQEQTETLKLILLHMEKQSGEVFTKEDLEDDYN